MQRFDTQYISLCRRILNRGERVVNYKKVDERGGAANSAIPDHLAQAQGEVVTYRVPHQVLEFDLEQEFPILHTKQVAFKTSTLEMLWIYQQMSNDVRWLQERGIKIWNEWEIAEDGTYMGRDINKLFAESHPGEPAENFAHTIGTAYGWIVRRYDLTRNLIETLQKNPGNRRMVMSLWQNEWLPTAALPSCVWNSQWNIINGRLNLLVTSRSTDVPLGLPFNISQYATLCHLLAHCLMVRPGKFTFITNDAHIYENQIEGIKEQIERYENWKPSDPTYQPAHLCINSEVRDFFAFDSSKELKDIKLVNYNHMGAIKMPIAA